MNNDETSKDSLGDRMKSYEALSTSRQLMPNCPIYARIDGRAFHTFCHGLAKPYSEAFVEAMQETCKYLVKETTAALGYVQSDEISLGWMDSQHCPFDGRIQKLESVIASMASSFFVWHILAQTRLARGPIQEQGESEEEFSRRYDEWLKVDYDNLHMRVQTGNHLPCFDCRVFNVPDTQELANCFLWRENDAIKNSISGLALHYYSHKELQGKNSDEKVHMMRMKGWCFFEDTEEAFLRGTFFTRQVWEKVLTDDEVAKIPEPQRKDLNRYADGRYWCQRSRIDKLDIPFRLTDIENNVGVLFCGKKAQKNKDNVTFDLRKRKKVIGDADRR